MAAVDQKVQQKRVDLQQQAGPQAAGAGAAVEVEVEVEAVQGGDFEQQALMATPVITQWGAVATLTQQKVRLRTL